MAPAAVHQPSAEATGLGTRVGTLRATLHVSAPDAGASLQAIELHFALDSHELPSLLTCISLVRNDAEPDGD